jgi:hypothetical protein
MTLVMMAANKMTLGIITFGVKTVGIMTLNIMTVGVMTPSKMTRVTVEMLLYAYNYNNYIILTVATVAKYTYLLFKMATISTNLSKLAHFILVIYQRNIVSNSSNCCYIVKGIDIQMLRHALLFNHLFFWQTSKLLTIKELA